jgi:hypothetical protein
MAPDGISKKLMAPLKSMPSISSTKLITSPNEADHIAGSAAAKAMKHTLIVINRKRRSLFRMKWTKSPVLFPDLPKLYTATDDLYNRRLVYEAHSTSRNVAPIWPSAVESLIASALASFNKDRSSARSTRVTRGDKR